MDKGHETFWLKKNEAVYRDDGTSTLRGNKYYPLFYKTIEPVYAIHLADIKETE